VAGLLFQDAQQFLAGLFAAAAGLTGKAPDPRRLQGQGPPLRETEPLFRLCSLFRLMPLGAGKRYQPM